MIISDKLKEKEKNNLMFTFFGTCLISSLILISVLLAQSIYLSEKKHKETTTNRLATGFFIFLLLAILTCLIGSYIGHNNNTVKSTAWKTLYPNQNGITATLRTHDNHVIANKGDHYVNVSENLSKDDLKIVASLKLTQGKAVKETDIDDVIVSGQGSTLDHVTYGIETKAIYLFGQRVFKDNYQRKVLKIVYKDSDSNKTLDNLLD